MPTSATGRIDDIDAQRRRRRLTASGDHRSLTAGDAVRRSPAASRHRGGFTLLEVLVVVAIAAIVASLVVLQLGDWRSPADPERQVERLAALIDHQCEQALFQSRPRGIRFTAEGYDFWQASGQGWVPVPESRVARPRAWHGEPRVDLVVGGHRVALDEAPPAPQLLCQPLGGIESFSLRLRIGRKQAALAGRPVQGLVMEPAP